MKFTVSAAAFMAFVSAALAQTAGFDTITKPTRDELVPAGKTYTITWEPSPSEYDDETITIVLLAGESPGKLFPDDRPVATGVVNSDGAFEWTVPADLGSEAVYGLRIDLESNPEIFQFSFPFQIEASEDGAQGNSTSIPVSSGTANPTSQPTAGSNGTSTVAPTQTVTSTRGGSSPTSGAGGDDADDSDDDANTLPENAASRTAAGAVAVLGALAVAVFGL